MRLRLLIIVLALLACASLHGRALPRAWAASGQTGLVINAGVSQVVPIPTGSVGYNNWPNCANGQWQASEVNVGELAPYAVTFQDWHVWIETAPGAAASGKQFVFTVRRNGVDTAMSVTIAETAKSATYTGTLTVAAGDVLTMSSTPTGTPAAPGLQSFYSTTTGGYQFIPFGANGGTSITSNSTKFMAAWGGISSDAVTENRPVPIAGSFRNLYVQTTGAPGAGESYTLTLETAADPGNGDPVQADTALTAQIAGASATTANDVAHSVHVNAGDFAQWKMVASAGAAASKKLYAGMEFVPDTKGLIYTPVEVIGQGASTTQYTMVAAVKAAEVDAQSPLPTATLSTLWAYVHQGTSTYTTLPAGTTVTLTLRKAGVDTALTVQATGTPGVRKVTDLTHTISFASGDVGSIRCDSSAGTGVISAHVGLVYSVLQPATGLLLLGVG